MRWSVLCLLFVLLAADPASALQGEGGLIDPETDAVIVTGVALVSAIGNIGAISGGETGVGWGLFGLAAGGFAVGYGLTTESDFQTTTTVVGGLAVVLGAFSLHVSMNRDGAPGKAAASRRLDLAPTVLATRDGRPLPGARLRLTF